MKKPNFLKTRNEKAAEMAVNVVVIAVGLHKLRQENERKELELEKLRLENEQLRIKNKKIGDEKKIFTHLRD